MPKPNKRPAPQSDRPVKRHKPAHTKDAAKGPAKAAKGNAKGKDKAADRGTIPIPQNDDEDLELSDQDMDVLEDYGAGVTFLKGLDVKGIARSKKETERLHQVNKPQRKPRVVDELPPIQSDDDDDEILDEESWNSDLPSDSGNSSDSDAEMPYETASRNKPAWTDTKTTFVKQLPIKLANGQVQQTGQKTLVEESESEDDDDVSVDSVPDEPEPQREDVATAARWGRPAVVDVIGNPSRRARLEAAKEQIASICQDISADPENSLGLLRRLHSFSLSKISTPAHPDPVINDLHIRKLAILSQMSIFKDIIPGYRIRKLTDKEKAEKVTQAVAQTRDWEQGLLVVYQTYLRSLEAELKARTDLAETCLRCMCTLLTEATHFNFRVNIMACVVARLSKKSWDESSDLCLNSLISVFREDLTGSASLEVVRLLNRMVKERRFNVNPNVLECLLHLRLKTELGTRSSESSADKNQSEHSSKKKNQKGKGTGQSQHLSKKAKKALKEQKEIQKEFREAEAEVDQEERVVTQTETLKLLFVLYFKIIKNPTPTPLLPAALHGISKYAHLVNIDFFRDLMSVLKGLVLLETTDEEEGIFEEAADLADKHIRHRLLCIVTAFELLSGQGEALNIDLADFVTHLYAIIPSLALIPNVDRAPPTRRNAEGRASQNKKNGQSLADLLFHALNIVFSPRSFGASPPTWRSAAFSKRLLAASLHWPASAALRALDFIGGLLAKDSKLNALFSTEDRTFDGVYRPEIDDPQLCQPLGTSFWELYGLQLGHCDSRVRNEANKLILHSTT